MPHILCNEAINTVTGPGELQLPARQFKAASFCCDEAINIAWSVIILLNRQCNYNNLSEDGSLCKVQIHVYSYMPYCIRKQ